MWRSESFADHEANEQTADASGQQPEERKRKLMGMGNFLAAGPKVLTICPARA
jgi:hypothetical protein